MRILDRQQYWSYLKAYLICFVALVGMYIVFHAFSNLDEFAEVSRGSVDLARRMGLYYLIRTSQFYDQLCGVIGMMAAIFTVTWMQRDNALLAMLAAGISTQRAIRPVLISAVLVSLISIANQEWVIPRYAVDLQRPPDDDGQIAVKVWSRTDVNEIVILGKSARRSAQTILEFAATLPISRFGALVNLEAREARYVPLNDPRSPLTGGWLLRGARLTPSDVPPDGTILVEVAPEDLADFPPPFGNPASLTGPSYFLRSNVTFEIATRSRQWYQYASTVELLRALNQKIGNTERNEISVFLHARLMRPCLSLCLLFLALPIVLGGGTKGMFVNLGLSLGTSAVFYAGVLLAQYLGANTVLAPELAAWSPLMVFGTVAAARWGRIRT